MFPNPGAAISPLPQSLIYKRLIIRESISARATAHTRAAAGLRPKSIGSGISLYFFVGHPNNGQPWHLADVHTQYQQDPYAGHSDFRWGGKFFPNATQGTQRAVSFPRTASAGFRVEFPCPGS